MENASPLPYEWQKNGWQKNGRLRPLPADIFLPAIFLPVGLCPDPLWGCGRPLTSVPRPLRLTCHPEGITIAKFEDDLLRQNRVIHDRWRFYRWADGRRRSFRWQTVCGIMASSCGSPLWPKAIVHRSLGRRPRNALPTSLFGRRPYSPRPTPRAAFGLRPAFGKRTAAARRLTLPPSAASIRADASVWLTP
jgi:hypothetical protein